MVSKKLSLLSICSVIASSLMLAPVSALAVAFNPGIEINASALLDTGPPFAGAPTQEATLSLTSGGVAATPTTYAGGTVTGDNPLAGALTDIGDSIGISLSADGIEGDESLFFGEYAIDLTNNTGVDFEITLGFSAINSVLLPGGLAGDDVFGISEFYVENLDTLEELYFSFREVDLFNDVDDTLESASSTYTLLLGQGQTVFLYGLNVMAAGAFDPGTQFDLDLTTAITILDVSPVPLPPAVLLFGSGALLITLLGRRKKASQQDQAV